MSRWNIPFIRIVALLVLLPTCCLGQSGQPGAAAASRDADLIKIFFTVNNGHGTLVSDLSKDSFQLREDGRPQTIQQFSSAPGIPLTLGLLVDTSGVMQNALPARLQDPRAQGVLCLEQ